MKDVIFTVIENKELCPHTGLMKLEGDTSEIKRPGEFVNLQFDGLYLRRPMSICDFDDHSLTIIYRVIGKGTGKMASMNPKDTLRALVGLGNGFDVEAIADESYFIGGGVGIAPLYCLVKKHSFDLEKTKIILGFNRKDDIFFSDEFRDLGFTVLETTMDGSFGTKGTVVEAIKEIQGSQKLPYVCACGPEPMIQAVYPYAQDGQYDLSCRMGCGFGACMGCTIETASGPARVCKEGPIFKQEEILW